MGVTDDVPPKSPTTYVMQYHIRGVDILGDEREVYLDTPHMGKIKVTFKENKGKFAASITKVKKIPKDAKAHSTHIDLRINYGEYLVGYTIIDKKNTITPSDLGKRKLYSIDKGKRIPLVYETLVTPKRPIYVMFRGQVGATSEKDAFFLWLDSGKVYIGALKPTFREYFFEGKLMKGRWVFRETLLKGSIDDNDTRSQLAFLFWYPDSQEPYVFSPRSRRKGYVPPKSYMPFPPYAVREEYAKHIRDMIVYLAVKWKMKEEEVWNLIYKWTDSKGKSVLNSIKEKLSEVWNYRLHQLINTAPTRNRDPKTRYFLRMKRGSRYMEFILDDLPEDDITLTKINGSPDMYSFEGEIEPMRPPYNPYRRYSVRDEIIDRGKLVIDDNIWEFHGDVYNTKFRIEGNLEKDPMLVAYLIEELAIRVKNEDGSFIFLDRWYIETPEGLLPYHGEPIGEVEVLTLDEIDTYYRTRLYKV